MNILPRSPSDRNDTSRSDPDSIPDDLDGWAGPFDRPRTRDRAEIPAERYVIRRELAEFLAHPTRPLD